jgi:hypothetical protein
MLGHRDGCHRKPLKTIERGHTPLIFQSRSVSAVAIGVVSKGADLAIGVLCTSTPLLAPRRRRRPHHRSLRPPELHRPPRTGIRKKESATSASRRLVRVGLMAELAVSARPSRAREDDESG